jgi:hypothetical protein
MTILGWSQHIPIRSEVVLNELDVVALTGDVPPDQIWQIPCYSPLRHDGTATEGLIPGDVGTIVYVQGGGEAFEVEFLQKGGYTVALVTLLPSQLRPATNEDLDNYRFRSVYPDSSALDPVDSLPNP